MKAVGSDLIITNVINDEEQAVLTLLVGRGSSLQQRLEACEFLVEEIKKGIEKEKEMAEQAAKEKMENKDNESSQEESSKEE